jgi:hypothetical protein
MSGMPTKTNRVTLAKWSTTRARDESLRQGNGYFYFSGGETKASPTIPKTRY